MVTGRSSGQILSLHSHGAVTEHIVHPCIVHCTLYTVHCTLYTVHYTIQCTVNSIAHSSPAPEPGQFVAAPHPLLPAPAPSARHGSPLPQEGAQVRLSAPQKEGQRGVRRGQHCGQEQEEGESDGGSQRGLAGIHQYTLKRGRGSACPKWFFPTDPF
jgi:hypothetical protein